MNSFLWAHDYNRSGLGEYAEKVHYHLGHAISRYLVCYVGYLFDAICNQVNIRFHGTILDIKLIVARMPSSRKTRSNTSVLYVYLRLFLRELGNIVCL